MINATFKVPNAAQMGGLSRRKRDLNQIVAMPHIWGKVLIVR